MSRVRPATTADLPYLVHLQQQFSNQIGFMPQAAYSAKIALGQAWLIEDNADPAGMVIANLRRDGRLHITQAAVDLDLQRSLHGARLIRYLARFGQFQGATSMTCSVREGLPAHAFWRALAFKPGRVRRARTARRRYLVDYWSSVDSVSIAATALTAATNPPTIVVPSEG